MRGGAGDTTQEGMREMARYRSKPKIIDAFRWTGGPDQEEDPVWACEAIGENVGTPAVAMLIRTLEGTMRADQGDWIIRGIAGEIYPCKPEIFAKSYEG